MIAKKTTLFCWLFVWTYFCYSQLPPNGDFEEWNIIDWGPFQYEEPNKWVSLNFMAVEHENFPVTKTNDAYSGEFAVKIQNIFIGNDTIPGLLRSSELPIISDGGAMEINEYYTSLKGKYKYFPDNGDTMMILSLFYKHDSIVAVSSYTQHQLVEEYAEFDIPIFYFNDFFDVPDSALIIIVAGNFENIRGNSVIYIDDLQFVKNNQIIINEFVSSNNSVYFDEENDAEDWIELFNAGPSPVILNNFFISDDLNNSTKWRIPAVLIDSEAYLTIFASGKDRHWPNLHTNFKISSSGEPLIFSMPTGEILDLIPPVELQTDISYGRYPNGGPEFFYFDQPTPNGPNITSPFFGFADIVPEFSVPGGFYQDSLLLLLFCSDPQAQIYYTTDGSVPNLNSNLYNGPISIKSREGEENSFSEIQTTADIFWKEPQGEVFKATTIRAKAIKPGYISTNTVTHSYFIDNNIFSRYNVPVLSLVTEKKNFFDHEEGIYILGKTYADWQAENPEDTTWLFWPGNFMNRGRSWERDIHIEYFENSSSELAFSQDLGVRIHGGISRHWRKKSLRLYSRESYGDDYIEHQIFPGNKKKANHQELSKYKRLILRNSGNDFEQTMLRDGFMHTLVNHTQVDVMAYQPAVVFLNGEYWGIHNIRERQDKYYLNSHYNIDTEDLVILEAWGVVNHGNPGDEWNYIDIIQFVAENDMNDPVNFQIIKSLIDTDNYLDYQTIQIFLNNTDWPGNNIKYWRKKTEEYHPISALGKDGRWRWLLFDTDFGFGLYGGFYAPAYNTLEFATAAGLSEWPNPDWSTMLFRNLLKNEKFRNDYINRTADHLNTSFKTQRVISVLDSIQDIYEPIIPEYIERWHSGANFQNWIDNIVVIRHFANFRPQYVAQHVIEKWDLPGTANITLDVSSSEMGKIKISSIIIDENTKGVQHPVYPWHGKYFQDVPIPVRAIPNPGYKFVKWEETNDTEELIFIVLDGPVSLTAIFENDPEYQGQYLFINEFMASNSTTISNSIGKFEDWIEIFNSSSDTIDLAGYYLTDNIHDPHKHFMAEGTDQTKIPPGGFLLLWADNNTELGPLHLSFKLSAGGEQIALIDPDGFTIVDSISFGTQITDISYGRYPDGHNNWIFFEMPTPGESNVVNYINDYNNLQENIVIYPNPVTDILFISEPADIRIYDINAKLVLESRNTDLIRIDFLKNGLYFVQINNAKIKKLIKH